MLNRREFLMGAAGGLVSVMAAGSVSRASQAVNPRAAAGGGMTRVSLVKTSDRASGIRKAVGLLGINPVKGKDVLLKPNFNTADPFPGSTHNDTLVSLISCIKEMGAGNITIGERSGPPDTEKVLREKGIYEICKKMDVRLVNFERLPEEAWIKIRPEQSHWLDGFYVAKPVFDAECIVTTCCLKTHGHGGVFTMSLKLAVGITHKKNMPELHASFRSIKKMIAEINQAYTPSLILLDGVEAFVDGGPAKGTRKRTEVIIAGTDRIAVDAVGLAALKETGSNKAIMERKIFGQEQIKRAIELGLGIKSQDEIELVAGDEAGSRYAERLKEVLAKG